ncbi:MAG: hypothetical protein JW928_02765 [Candidatus Aureabacteria bacterium]|nr:hypothetical protein [Candidatus Auribacterota bacterium]
MSRFKSLSTGTFILILFSLSPSCYPADKCSVCIIKSRNLAPYEYVSQKVLESLQECEESIESRVFDMEGDPEKGKQIVQEIEQAPPDIVLSIGSESTLFLAENVDDIPIIFTMVYKYDKINQALSLKKNFRGVFVNLEMEEPFQILKRIYPELRKLGVMYIPQYFEDQITDFEEAAKKSGIEIMAIEIKEEADIPKAIRDFSPQIDALYLLSNPLFTKKEVIKRIILGTLQSKVFVVGESLEVVKKGGLLGLGFEINHVIQSTSEMIKDYYRVKDIEKLHNRKCEGFNLYINERTSKNLGISIPEDLKKTARKIIP